MPKKVKSNKGDIKQVVKKSSFDNYQPPLYQEIKQEIEKKIGGMVSRPLDLETSNWSEQAIKVLEERYLLKDKNLNIIETPEDMLWRVSYDIASSEARWGAKKKDILKIAKDFYNLMLSKKFLPNSPTLMNAGTGNGLQYSACFVLPIEDSMEGIFDALKYQALIHKTGGGTGFSFSRLRESGSIVRTSSGTASGPISFMRIFDSATNEVKQGGKRRGANMGIIRVDHPDVLNFIHCKESGGITNFNISIALTDKFMQAYQKGEEYELISPKTKEVVGKLNAKEVFDEIASGAWKTGDPGLIFIDKINRSTANPVPTLGAIEATNPCVTGDTLVYTNNGLIRIDELYYNRKNTNVLSDSRLSDVIFQPTSRILQTGQKQTYKLITKEGYELNLTADHKVLTQRGWVKAIELKKGDEINISNRLGGFSTQGSLEEGRVIGWLVGDGTMKLNQAVLSFFGHEKQELAPKFARMVSHIVDGKQLLLRDYGISVIDIKDRDEARVQSTRLARYMNSIGLTNASKLKVPENVFKGSWDMQRGFLQGLFTADGHVAGNANKGLSVRLTSISDSLLKDVQRLLLNFGIFSKIYTQRRKEGKRLLPNGKGGLKEYSCKEYSDLSISKDSLVKFKNYIGFLSESKNIKLQIALDGYKQGTYKEKYTASFLKLVKKGIEMVYDLTVPGTSSFIANGLVVHNCGEQPLYPFDACNLGSIFLTYFVKDGKVLWDDLKNVAKMSVRFLDDVIEVNPYPLQQIRKTVFAIRRIGLGVGGWADMLISLGIPYDSQEALNLAEKVMQVIYDSALEESQRLAKERGAFPLFKESIYKDDLPRRNSTITTIAPTGTISIIAGASSGIEPIFACAYRHIVKDQHLDRNLSFINPKFEEMAREGGFWSQELMDKVATEGMIRHMTQIPEKVRNVFGTAHEIDPEWHIKTQSAFQKYTENAVSKTINLRHDVTVEDVKKAYLLAWDSDCKGITVFRDGCKDVQVLNVGVKDKEVKDEINKEEVQEEVKLVEWTRPMALRGSTYKIKTPVGTAFITVNVDEMQNPVEVFINIGRAGSDVQAMAEALGRLISKSLKFSGKLTIKERAMTIIDQLRGIGGRRSVGFGQNRILSLPDAVAVAMATNMGLRLNGHIHDPSEEAKKEPENLEKEHQNSILNQGQLLDVDTNKQNYNLAVDAIGDICPSCGASTFVYEEGCSKCYSCAYTEC